MNQNHFIFHAIFTIRHHPEAPVQFQISNTFKPSRASPFRSVVGKMTSSLFIAAYTVWNVEVLLAVC